LNRFRSDEGYVLLPGVKEVLGKFRELRIENGGRVVTGVITNSDDRVPEILTSLGLRVSPRRFGSEPTTTAKKDETNDIDFSVMSYDVGYEKPDERIFRAAEDTALKAVANASEGHWERLYVGDDYVRDVGGALNARWKVVLLDREGQSDDGLKLERLSNEQAGDLFDILASNDAVVCESLTQLARWLPENP
jgi:FMN phosphatase YigB (HAD superfamily)